MSAPRLLVIFAVVATLIRCGIVYYEEVSPQEAYYFLCSERPAEAYFDGPAGTAMMIRAAGPAWRFLSPLWALAATLACFVLGRRMGSEKLAVWAAIALNTLPVFNTAALRVGPELPALTFVLLALACFRNAYDEDKQALLWWMLAGVFSGLGVWFAYAVTLIFPGILLVTLISPKHRRGRDFLGLTLVLSLMLAAMMSAVVWNAQQDWIPIAGGTFRTLWEFSASGFVHALWKSMKQFSPLIILVMILGAIVAAAESRHHLRARFVFVGTLAWVATWGYFLLRGADVPLLLLLAAPLLLFHVLGGEGLWRKFVLGSLAVAVLFSMPAVLGTMKEGKAWKAVAQTLRQTEEKQAQGVADGVFFIAENEHLAAILGYYLQRHYLPPVGHPAVYARESQAMTSQFDLWPSYDDFIESTEVKEDRSTEEKSETEGKGENPFLGRSALYIGREKADDLPQAIRGAFQSVQEISKITIPGNPTAAEPLYIYLCLNYETLPL